MTTTSPLGPFLVLYADSLLAAYTQQPTTYSVVGLLSVYSMHQAFPALQQVTHDWTQVPGNVRLVSDTANVRSAGVFDVLITTGGEIWRFEPHGLAKLAALPGPATLSDDAVRRLNAASGPQGLDRTRRR